MSDKMECPGCESCTSTMLEAYNRGRSCPYCGLSASAIDDVLAARRRHADADLTAKYEEAVKRTDKAERELALVRQHLRQIKDAVARAPEPSPW